MILEATFHNEKNTTRTLAVGDNDFETLLFGCHVIKLPLKSIRGIKKKINNVSEATKQTTLIAEALEL